MSHDPSGAPGHDIDPIPTRVGWSLPGDHYWFGRLLGAELAGNTGVPQLLAHAVGSGDLDNEALAVLDDLATVMSVADPRIWPLKLGRVVASYGNGMAAIAAVELAFDSDYIGPWTCRQAAQLLVDLREELGPEIETPAAVERAVLRRLGQKGRLIGFGVPARGEDERVVALRACMTKRGRRHLPAWALLEQVSEVLYRERRLRPNIGLGVGAAALDAGFQPDQIGYLAVALMQNVIVANAVEGAAQAPAVLRQLPAGTVIYKGAPPRRSPRALE
ncbi:MAG: hypothetical protein QM820_31025 [Minicystis sp.]